MKSVRLAAVFAVIMSVAFASLSYAAKKEAAALAVKSVEASTVEKAENPEGAPDVSAKNILDGDMNTRWSSEFSDDNWIVLQLKKKATIKKVVIDWETACAKSYKILVSNNNKKWTEVYSTDNCAGGHEEIDLEKASGKYVKIELLKRATEWGFSIFELQVLGY
ncbi:MAG: discoidin domain-containing protein [Elusimicrobiota bacterium]